MLVAGGSIEVPGAIVLAGLAALRAGAGKVPIATCRDVAPAIAVAVPESLRHTQAAVWGVYLHSGAGRVMTTRMGKVGFLARELLAEIPALLAQFDED